MQWSVLCSRAIPADLQASVPVPPTNTCWPRFCGHVGLPHIFTDIPSASKSPGIHSGNSLLFNFSVFASERDSSVDLTLCPSREPSEEASRCSPVLPTNQGSTSCSPRSLRKATRMHRPCPHSAAGVLWRASSVPAAAVRFLRVFFRPLRAR